VSGTTPGTIFPQKLTNIRPQPAARGVDVPLLPRSPCIRFLSFSLSLSPRFLFSLPFSSLPLSLLSLSLSLSLSLDFFSLPFFFLFKHAAAARRKNAATARAMSADNCDGDGGWGLSSPPLRPSSRFLRVNAEMCIVSSLGDCTGLSPARLRASAGAARRTGSISRSIENRLGIPE